MKNMPKNFKDLDLFIDRLIQEKGLESLEPELLNQVKTDLKDRIEDIINATILEKLTPEKLADFEKLLDSKASDETIQKFCKENIPNLEEVLARVFLDFRQTYLGK